MTKSYAHIRAVVVEDEPLPRERLARILRELGATVLAEFRNGQEFLDWVNAGNRTDVAFMDMEMPGRWGLEVLRELTLPPKIIFVTAHAELWQESLEAGGLDYVMKPAEPQRIERALAKVWEVVDPRQKLEKAMRLLTAEKEGRICGVSLTDQKEKFLLKQQIAFFFMEEEKIYFQALKSVYRAKAFHSMAQLDQETGGFFFDVHQSYRVNLGKVVGVDSTGRAAELLMEGGSRVPIARRKVGAIRQALGL